MKKLKTNYVPGDPVTSAGQNEVNATINEIYEKLDGNALNVPEKSAQYHMVFKDKANDPTNPCSTLELAGFTGVYFEEITAEAYNALASKYTDPLPAKISDPAKIYRLDDVKEEFALIPYTKGDGKGDDKTVPGSITHKWGDAADVVNPTKKQTVGAGSGVQIGAKYYKFALYDKPIRIQLEASHDIDLKTDTSLNLVAKKSVIVESKEVVLDGPTRFELGELEDGFVAQFKATGGGNTKGCDKLVVELYNNSKDSNDNPIPATINIAEQNFLKGTPIYWWYVIANVNNDGNYNASTNPTGKWLEEKTDVKKEVVAANYGFAKGDIDKAIHHFDMGTDTFYNEGTLDMPAKSKVAVASAHLFDIIKFTAWAKNNNFGPWAANTNTGE